jgi:hypothetical protein
LAALDEVFRLSFLRAIDRISPTIENYNLPGSSLVNLTVQFGTNRKRCIPFNTDHSISRKIFHIFVSASFFFNPIEIASIRQLNWAQMNLCRSGEDASAIMQDAIAELSGAGIAPIQLNSSSKKRAGIQVPGRFLFSPFCSALETVHDEIFFHYFEINTALHSMGSFLTEFGWLCRKQSS